MCPFLSVCGTPVALVHSDALICRCAGAAAFGSNEPRAWWRAVQVPVLVPATGLLSPLCVTLIGITRELATASPGLS